MKVGFLVVFMIVVVVGLAMASGFSEPVFVLNPMDGHLQVVALNGDVKGGEVDIFVNGTFVGHVAFVDLALNESDLLTIVPNPHSVFMWEIKGDYNYTWSKWNPPTPFDFSLLGPDGLLHPTIDFETQGVPPIGAGTYDPNVDVYHFIVPTPTHPFTVD